MKNIDAERAAFNEWFDETMYRETARDAMEAAWLAARRTPSASIGEDGLPELPAAEIPAYGDACAFYTADQMREFARDAVAAYKRKHAALQEMVDIAQENDMGYGAPQAAQGVKTWQERYMEACQGPAEPGFRWHYMLEEIADLRSQLARQSQGVNALELFSELRDAVTECINYERNSKNWSAADYWRDILNQFDEWLAAPPLSSEQQAEKGEK